MKKNYTVSLDEEKVDILKPWLEKKGMSFSGYLNGAVDEMVTAITEMNLPEDVSKMPIGQFMKTFTRLMKHMGKREP
jgi:hypothetical protein